MIESIRKRDGRIVKFDPEKIAAAIAKAFVAVGQEKDRAPASLARKVVEETEQQILRHNCRCGRHSGYCGEGAHPGRLQ